MLKQILNLDGAQELGKKKQKSINGGFYIGTECTSGKQEDGQPHCNWRVECCSYGHCITKEGNEWLCGLTS